MRIPFYDLKAVTTRRRDSLIHAFTRVLDSGWFVLGTNVQEFERRFAKVGGATGCVGVGSGLDALEMALRAFGVGPGSQVVVPSHTFFATWLSVLKTGAELEVVDVDERSWLLPVDQLDDAIDDRTAAIVPVHLYGATCDMGSLCALAESRGIPVVADAAQAHGARIDGRGVCEFGDAAAFSFYPTKTLGLLGDGGAVCFTAEANVERCRRLRDYGRTQKYEFAELGFNSRLDEVQAAMGLVKLDYLEEEARERRGVMDRYRSRLAPLQGTLDFQRTNPGSEPSWHLAVVRTTQRDELQTYLTDRGIGTGIHYPIACGDQPAVAHIDIPPERLRTSQRLAAEVLSLPLWPGMDLALVDEVSEAILSFF